MYAWYLDTIRGDYITIIGWTVTAASSYCVIDCIVRTYTFKCAVVYFTTVLLTCYSWISQTSAIDYLFCKSERSLWLCGNQRCITLVYRWYVVCGNSELKFTILFWNPMNTDAWFHEYVKLVRVEWVIMSTYLNKICNDVVTFLSFEIFRRRLWIINNKY